MRVWASRSLLVGAVVGGLVGVVGGLVGARIGRRLSALARRAVVPATAAMATVAYA